MKNSWDLKSHLQEGPGQDTVLSVNEYTPFEK